MKPIMIVDEKGVECVIKVTFAKIIVRHPARKEYCHGEHIFNEDEIEVKVEKILFDFGDESLVDKKDLEKYLLNKL